MSLIRFALESRGAPGQLGRGLGVALCAALALAGGGCEEETTPETPRIDINVSPIKLNLAEKQSCQSDSSVNRATVAAMLFGVKADEASVVFRIDTEAMSTLIPTVSERGDGGFTAPASDDPAAVLAATYVATYDAVTSQAAAQFRCTREGKVPVRAQEVSTGISSEVKTIVCEYKDPADYAFSIVARDAVTRLGQENPLTVLVDDKHGGSYLKSQSILLKAERGGTFEPDQAGSATRVLQMDADLGYAVPSTAISFRCPSEEGTYPILVEFAQKDRNCDSRGTTYVTCSAQDVKNRILIGVERDTLEAASTENPIPLNNQTLLTLTVYGPTSAERERAVSLSTDRGGFVLRAGDRPISRLSGDGVKTDSDGRLTVTFVGRGDAGVATIKASALLTARSEDPNELALYGNGLQVEGNAQVKIIGATSVEYVDAIPKILGVRGSGFNESSRVRFQVMGSDGNPYPPGLAVDFDIASNAGGASLSQPTAETDSEGVVYTTLNSGTVAANVTVRATVRQNGSSSDSPAIPIIGVRPNWGGFALKCDLKNVGAFFETDGLNSLIMEDIPCRTRLVDRFGNPVGLSTAVSFRSEAGTISASVSSVPQTYTAGGGVEQAQENVGNVVALFNTFGVLPMDVARAQGEPVIDAAVPNVNPRDGLVTILAFAAGEEAFADANGNGEYDEGEQFVDLPEPFVDYDDDSIRDEFEPFIDLPDELGNYDGVWNDGNDRWDRSTTIWTETRLMYTGLPRTSFPNGRDILLADDEFSPGATGCNRGPFCSAEHVFLPGEYCYQIVQWVDARGNIPNSSATYRTLVNGPIQLVQQGGAAAGDQLGLDWGLEKDCGPDGLQKICLVHSQVYAYRELRPQVPLSCFKEEWRRIGHIHWVRLEHPDQADPMNPPDGPSELVPCTVSHECSVRSSPSSSDIFSFLQDYLIVVQKVTQ
ncbi:MAG: hypothetical protein RBU45_00190 [Myxococcota bacterium]|jgi:hypothetical protein|nr:hypothetical protein [Myxococcota bacterium]